MYSWSLSGSHDFLTIMPTDFFSQFLCSASMSTSSSNFLLVYHRLTWLAICFALLPSSFLFLQFILLIFPITTQYLDVQSNTLALVFHPVFLDLSPTFATCHPKMLLFSGCKVYCLSLYKPCSSLIPFIPSEVKGLRWARHEAEPSEECRHAQYMEVRWNRPCHHCFLVMWPYANYLSSWFLGFLICNL